jgi:hypothetical protein
MGPAMGDALSVSSARRPAQRGARVELPAVRAGATAANPARNSLSVARNTQRNADGLRENSPSPEELRHLRVVAASGSGRQRPTWRTCETRQRERIGATAESTLGFSTILPLGSSLAHGAVLDDPERGRAK